MTATDQGRDAAGGLEALLASPPDSAGRTDAVLAVIRAAISSGAAEQAARIITANPQRLGPAAGPALIALLDLPEPPDLQALLEIAQPLALAADAPPQLGRLALRALVRWGDLRRARAALGQRFLDGPADASDSAVGWRDFADKVQVEPPVRLLMQALVHARSGESRATVEALDQLNSLGREVQAGALVEQVLQIAGAAADAAILDALAALEPLVPTAIRPLILESRGHWDEAFARLLDAPTLDPSLLRRAAAHVRRRSQTEGAAAVGAALLDHAREAGPNSWVAALLALRRRDPAAMRDAIDLARAFVANDPGNITLAEALRSAATCCGDLPTVRALWQDAFDHADAGSVDPLLWAVAALRLGKARNLDRALTALEDQPWTSGEPHDEDLVALYTLAAEADHPELERIWRVTEAFTPAQVLSLAEAARVRGAEALILRLAGRLAHLDDLSIAERVRVGDLFALHGEQGEAFEIYRNVRAAEPMRGNLANRLLTSLEADEVLAKHVEAGDGPSALDRMRTYLAPEMQEQPFELRSLLRPAQIAAAAVRFVEAIPARDIVAPHARFAEDPIAWRGQTVQHPSIWAAELPDAEVVGWSPAVLASGSVIYPPLEAPHAHRYSHRDSAAVIGRGERLLLRLRPVSRRFDRAVNLLGFGASNYYHWLYDICSRFIALEALGPAAADTVLLVDEAALRVPQLGEVLSRFNRARLPIIPVAAGERVAADRLVTAAPAAWGPFHHRDPAARFEAADVVILPEAVQLLRRVAHHELATPNGPRRILLTRRGASNARLQNEPEIADLLTARFGFEVVDPARMSFAEQARTFASAEAIVGASGAAMANLAFCRPFAGVFCLMADRYDYAAWPTLAEAAGAEVLYLTGRIQEFSRNRNHSPFTVDPQALADALVAAGFG